MKHREFYRKLQLLGIVTLGTLPVVPLLFAHLCPEILHFAPIWCVSYLFLSAFGLLSPGKWRLAWAIPVTLGLGVLCVFLAPEEGWMPMLAAWLIYGILFLWSLQLGRWEREDELPPLLTLFLLGIQLFGQLMLFGDSLKDEPVLKDCALLLKAGFLGFLLLTVLGLNRGSMNNASGDKRSVTGAMRRKNVWMTLGIFGLAVAASFIPYIYDWIRKAVIWAVAILLWLLAHLFPEQKAAGSSGGGDGDLSGLLPQDDTSPSLFMQILEKVLIVAVCLLLLALVGYVGYKLFLLIRKLLRKLWAALERYAQTVSEDYVDEITDTRETGEGSRSRLRFGSTRPKAPKGGTPEEQIRYRYRLLLWKHPEWSKGTTAREKLPQEAAEIYERARYSQHPVTEEEAEAFQAMQNSKCKMQN